MVERVRDERTFSAAYGIRTLSQLEKMYDLRASNNPSNWLGPIWGISNYLVFRGLQKYRLPRGCADLAEKTVAAVRPGLRSERLPARVLPPGHRASRS